MFGGQNNYQNQVLSIILYHKDKPIPELVEWTALASPKIVCSCDECANYHM